MPNMIPVTAPVRGHWLSALNGGVCWIETGAPGSGRMCGHVAADRAAFRRHTLNEHPGVTRYKKPVSWVAENENRDGVLAMKRFVRSGGWRNAVFALEPGRGPRGGCIDYFATALEELAAEDADFAARYGRKFHRVAVVGPDDEEQADEASDGHQAGGDGAE